MLPGERAAPSAGVRRHRRDLAMIDLRADGERILGRLTDLVRGLA
jgi:hypothetical protein